MGKHHLGAFRGKFGLKHGFECQKGFETWILVKNYISKCSRELFIQLKNLTLADYNLNSHVPTKFTHKGHFFGGQDPQLVQNAIVM